MKVLRREDDLRILAVDPTSRGFGFVVLEGAARLIDWGTTDAGRADDERALRDVEALLMRYTPDVVVLEAATAASSRRRARVRGLLAAIERLAATRGAETARVSRDEVRAVFAPAGATTKYRIATVIAGHFPALVPRLPPARKPWMSEDARMAIFDAASFALAYCYHLDDTESSPPADSRD